MKRLSLFFICMTYFANLIFAESLAVLSNKNNDTENSAIIYSAKEALKDLSLRYKKDLSIKNITPKKDNILAEEQALILEKAQADGLMGAMLIPSQKGDIKKLKDTISSLRQKKFYVALLRKDLKDSQRIFFISSDSKKIIERLNRELTINNSKSDLSVINFYYTPKEKFIIDTIEIEELTKNEDKDILYFIEKQASSLTASSHFFSNFYEKFKQDINRLDTHGFIFFDSSMLIDMLPLSNDSDRVFCISLDIQPHLNVYLQTRQISLAVGDDYYGFAFLSTQKIVEAYMDGKFPQIQTMLLPPVIYTPDNVEKFEKDWLIYMQ